MYNKRMEKIFTLCPSLAYMEFTERMEAVVRMCIAHVLNGNEYKSLYVTAQEYLENLGE